MSDDGFEPRIVGFLCNWCTYTAADSAGVGRMTQPPNVDIIRVMCSGCKTCLLLCPYTAISFIDCGDNKGVAEVNEALCKGCGTCVAACPAGAITARHFSDRQIIAELEGLFRMPVTEPVGA